MWSSSISAIVSFLRGRSSPSELATASLRALVGASRCALLLLLLHLLAFLQLARERPVRAVHHRLALVDAVEDLHVGAAGDAGVHLAHLRDTVLVHHEHHLD